ncbi:hypothetical protein FGG08_006996 [Glutinoglossum americanum]|uniref:Uncharacterized protein n=1 Tax=Glutinoglossum americanum TaxID=1670608 RepID=A0A9P8HZR5_9PEZI|nr:hypothetical protein FGG08_006996 [Glutinoglossum americanum]
MQKLVVAGICVLFSPVLLGVALLAVGLGIVLVGAAVCIAGAAVAFAALAVFGVFWLIFQAGKLAFYCCLGLPAVRGAPAPDAGDPVSRWLARWFGPPLTVEDDTPVMVQILEKNRERRVSRFGREAAAPLGQGLAPSRAWCRLEAAAEGPPALRACGICEEDLLDFRFPDRDVSDDCRGHARTACLRCVAMEIQRTLELRAWSEARCVLCPGRLTHAQIHEFAFKEVFEK